jgi:hypothetical protein
MTDQVLQCACESGAAGRIVLFVVNNLVTMLARIVVSTSNPRLRPAMRARDSHILSHRGTPSGPPCRGEE